MYLAEGSNAYGFSTDIEALVAGTGGNTTAVNYMTATGAKARPSIPCGQSRKVTIHTSTEAVAGLDFSTWLHNDDPEQYMAAGRMMYWNNGSEGTLAGALKKPEKTWYLPEGCTDYGFETFILLQNGNPTPAHATLTYMTLAGPSTPPAVTIPANGRVTVNLMDILPRQEVSTKVVADLPIMAERSMYWDNRRGGHDSTGVSAPANDFYLAEGTTAYGFDEWILVQNPNNQACQVDVTFMTYAGGMPGPSLVMAPNTRATIHANNYIGADFSTKVHGNLPVIDRWNIDSCLAVRCSRFICLMTVCS